MEYFIAHSFSERGREWDSGYLRREERGTPTYMVRAQEFVLTSGHLHAKYLEILLTCRF